MKRIIFLTSLCLAGVAGPTLADSQMLPSQNLQLAQDTTTQETPPSAAEQRDDRIQQNTERRTTNREERREGAANAVGMPGLDQGIQRRNERRENRRDYLRTGQPAPADQTAPPPPPRQ